MDEPNERSSLLLREDGVHSPSQSISSVRRASSVALPPFHEDLPSGVEPSSAATIWTVVPVLIVGVLVAHGDTSLVVASSQTIASEFNALSGASWLVTSYGLAQCASQPLYGKLSDIFGRKANLVVSYILFAAGCLICGIGQSYWQVLTGRAISGVGSAGMTALVSIIIADMVPVRDVAAWRSYVNVAATTGRSLGGPVGGLLTDTIGWRWSFYGQCPLVVAGLILILWKVPSKITPEDTERESTTLSQKMKRVDVFGAITLALTISCFLLALDSGAKEAVWYQTVTLGAVTIIAGVSFCCVEKWWAPEPILPLELLAKRVAFTSYLIVGLQTSGQFALFYSVPIYFQIATGASVTSAGLKLFPAVVGNAVGGLISGLIISRTGRYKILTVLGCATASLGYLLVLIRWHGTTRWPELIYFGLGGFGTGIIQSTTFIHLAANLEASEMAIAGTTLYLASGIFMLIGIQLSTSVVHVALRAGLNTRLDGYEQKNKIIELVMSSAESIRQLAPHVQRIVTRAYIDSLSYSYAISFALAFAGLLMSLTVQEPQLD